MVLELTTHHTSAASIGVSIRRPRLRCPKKRPGRELDRCGYALVKEAFQLYEAFRPEIPKDESGWGAKGKLSLKKIQELAAQS